MLTGAAQAPPGPLSLADGPSLLCLRLPDASEARADDAHLRVTCQDGGGRLRLAMAADSLAWPPACWSACLEHWPRALAWSTASSAHNWSARQSHAAGSLCAHGRPEPVIHLAYRATFVLAAAPRPWPFSCPLAGRLTDLQTHE